MDLELTHGYNLASKEKRLIASIIQFLIILLVMVIFYLIFGKTLSHIWHILWETSEISSGLKHFTDFMPLFLIIGIVVYPLFTGNIGHWIFNLKVISEDTGEDFKQPHLGALREVLKYFFILLIIPILWILWDSKNQNLYDKITRTIVVEKE